MTLRFAIFFLCVFLLPVSQAFALSCAPYSTEKEARNADLFAIGRIESLQEGSGTYSIIYRIKILKALSGSNRSDSPSVIVVQKNWLTKAGKPMPQLNEVVLFAAEKDTDGRYSIDLCSLGFILAKPNENLGETGKRLINTHKK